MSNDNSNNELNAQKNAFKKIVDILKVPLIGKPLNDLKWILPCPDEKALDDFPEPENKKNDWKNNWTSCKKKE
jgi:hypothetical protein